jgi:4-(gamma-glutamylamino)butanal dehydrogenase
MTEFTQEQVDAEVQRLELDGTKVSTVVEGRCFIDGNYVDAVSGETFTTSNPATGKVVARVASGDEADVNLAVKAARRTFEQGVWCNKSPSERQEILLEWARLMERQETALELAVLDSVEAGKVIRDNLKGDVPGAIGCLRYHAQAINKLYDHIAPTGPSNLGLIVKEPVGVCGLITPWNFPLLMAIWKLAPSLAVGCSGM